MIQQVYPTVNHPYTFELIKISIFQQHILFLVKMLENA